MSPSILAYLCIESFRDTAQLRGCSLFFFDTKGILYCLNVTKIVQGMHLTTSRYFPPTICFTLSLLFDQLTLSFVVRSLTKNVAPARVYVLGRSMDEPLNVFRYSQGKKHANYVFTGDRTSVWPTSAYTLEIRLCYAVITNADLVKVIRVIDRQHTMEVHRFPIARPRSA
ncbi:hypothetical protein J3A83DRAFT_346904 [Scleroderma citrinum]